MKKTWAIILMGVLLILSTTFPILAQEREGPFVKTNKTLTQLVSEGFEVKSVFGVISEMRTRGIIFVVQKKGVLYVCSMNSESSKTECNRLDEK